MRLSVNEIAYLADRFESSTDISLFKNLKATLTGMENLSLMEKGVLVGDDLQKDAKALMDVVAGAKQCARVYVKDPNFIMEKYVYRNGTDYVLVENAGDELQFRNTSDFTEVKDHIGAYMGRSTVRSAEFDATLSRDALIVYLAIVDLYRQGMIKSYLGQDAQAEIDLSAIRKALDDPAPNALVTMMVKNYGFNPGTIKDLTPCIRELSTKGCVEDMGGLQLTSEHALFAGRLLMPDMAMILEVLSIDEQNGLSTASGLVISAGVRDNLSLTFLQGEVELSTLSTEMLLELVEIYLRCPVE